MMSVYEKRGIAGNLPKVIIGLFVSIIGISLLLITIIGFVLGNAQYMETSATIVNQKLEENKKWRTYLKYQVNNQEYYNEILLLAEENIGSEITIYYNSNNPNRITITNENANFIFLVVGFIFIIIGISELKQGIKNIKNKRGPLVSFSSYTCYGGKPEEDPMQETGFYIENNR